MEPDASHAVMDAVESPAGQLADFDAVVHDWWPRVFRFALASLRDRDAAESVAQDCFWKAYRARDRFRGDSSLKTWLMQIAVNLVRDRARNRRLQFWRRFDTEVHPRIADGRRSPEEEAAARQQVAAVWSAARVLPERQRTVFLLRFVEDLDLLEIAAATGMKEGTVKAHLSRALKTVRERLVK
jgi:RNA polymerase sigma-70 factor (ECF subfamily)